MCRVQIMNKFQTSSCKQNTSNIFYYFMLVALRNPAINSFSFYLNHTRSLEETKHKRKNRLWKKLIPICSEWIIFGGNVGRWHANWKSQLDLMTPTRSDNLISTRDTFLGSSRGDRTPFWNREPSRRRLKGKVVPDVEDTCTPPSRC